MKILFDTNIILDTLARREPFFAQSQAVLQLVAEGKAEGAVTANSVTDIYYILRKHLGKEAAKASLCGLLELLEVLDLTGDDCLTALDMPLDDYEDSILARCAKNWAADHIVTRNTKDFSHSPVQATTPEDFLKILPRE